MANDLSSSGPVGGVEATVGGAEGNGNGNLGHSNNASNTTLSSHSTTLSIEHQQFNIFPAIFSRQLNFSSSTTSHCGQTKLMDELRPNLGLLGVNLMESETFHINHQEKRKCNSTSSNEQDFMYGVHPGLETSSSTGSLTTGRNNSNTSTLGNNYKTLLS